MHKALALDQGRDAIGTKRLRFHAGFTMGSTPSVFTVVSASKVPGLIELFGDFVDVTVGNGETR